MLNFFDLTGKVALVTGASKGLGLAMAKGLAQAGARVAVAARTSPNDDELAFFACNLLHEEQRAGLVNRVVESLGGIDIFVHCAGAQHREPALHCDMKVWRDMQELHVTAAFDLSRQAARHMIPKKHGRIILVTSVLGFQGGLYIPGYVAAKHVIVGLTRSLANEWSQHGVNVNAIAPGYMNTDMLQGLSNDPVRWPQIVSRIPAQRAGDPEELVGAAVFLASAASSYVTGHTLAVDGGWLSR